MLKTKRSNQYSGVYRIRDSINNLQLRISLRKLHSIIKIPKFEGFQQSSTDQPAAGDFEEIIEVKWQQKIFSKAEQTYYSLKENCKSDLEKRYHQMVKELAGGDCGTIFTYIDEDNYEPADNFGPDVLKITNLRRNVESKEADGANKKSDMFVDPRQRLVSSRYSRGDEFTKMFIMANLEPTTLLVTIHYRESDGVFFIFPDFNELENEYQLEIDQNSKQTFGFVVENLSMQRNDGTNQLAQKEKLNKIQDETLELMRKLHLSKDPDFEYPKFCRIVLLMEIIDGRCFEYDNLHVRFEIKLPKFVKVVDGNLEGTTHSSFKQEGFWNFGHCLLPLVFDIDDEFSLSTSKLDLLSVKFEVISIDPTWGRERREGIASLKIPLDRDNDNEVTELSCFRDLQSGSRFQDFLERFFLGGVHKATNDQAPLSNFYGNQTVTTGKLRVKIQKITQTKLSKRSYLQMQTIDDIISSYHKAKAKLHK